MSNKESVIICGFPGVGKTYAFDHAEELGLKLQDSDSSHFHWLYEDDDHEFKNPLTNALGEKFVNPNWPTNYIQYIELTGREQEIKPDFIFVSTHDEVIKALKDKHFETYILIPSIRMKDKYLERYKERGSSDSFIELMDKKWKDFIMNAMSFNSDEISVFILNDEIESVYDFIKCFPDIPGWIKPVAFDN